MKLRIPDVGWPYVISGLVVCAAGVLIPARADLQQMSDNVQALRMEADRHATRLRSYSRFLDELEQANPALVRRLAATELNLMPPSDVPVLVDADSAASVTDWIDQQVAVSLARTSSMPAVQSDSILTRLATGPYRLWLFGGGVFCVFVGLLMSPEMAARQADLGRPADRTSRESGVLTAHGRQAQSQTNGVTGRRRRRRIHFILEGSQFLFPWVRRPDQLAGGLPEVEPDNETNVIDGGVTLFEQPAAPEIPDEEVCETPEPAIATQSPDRAAEDPDSTPELQQPACEEPVANTCTAIVLRRVDNELTELDALDRCDGQTPYAVEDSGATAPVIVTAKATDVQAPVEYAVESTVDEEARVPVIVVEPYGPAAPARIAVMASSEADILEEAASTSPVSPVVLPPTETVADSSAEGRVEMAQTGDAEYGVAAGDVQLDEEPVVEECLEGRDGIEDVVVAVDEVEIASTEVADHGADVSDVRIDEEPAVEECLEECDGEEDGATDVDGEVEAASDETDSADAEEDGDEYEYVDENGKKVEPSEDDDEYEYVDENGKKVEPAGDDDEYEYVYVDEDGNEVEPEEEEEDEDDEYEYVYVDEDGNEVAADDDAEYEYVDGKEKNEEESVETPVTNAGEKHASSE